MIENNKDKQDLEYYNEVLDELRRLRRQTRNRYKEFESISVRCYDVITMTINNSILFINHHKDILENETDRENQEN